MQFNENELKAALTTERGQQSALDDALPTLVPHVRAAFAAHGLGAFAANIDQARLSASGLLELPWEFLVADELSCATAQKGCTDLLAGIKNCPQDHFVAFFRNEVGTVFGWYEVSLTAVRRAVG